MISKRRYIRTWMAATSLLCGLACSESETQPFPIWLPSELSSWQDGVPDGAEIRVKVDSQASQYQETVTSWKAFTTLEIPRIESEDTTINLEFWAKAERETGIMPTANTSHHQIRLGQPLPMLWVMPPNQPITVQLKSNDSSAFPAGSISSCQNTHGKMVFLHPGSNQLLYFDPYDGPFLKSIEHSITIDEDSACYFIPNTSEVIVLSDCNASGWSFSASSNLTEDSPSLTPLPRADRERPSELFDAVDCRLEIRTAGQGVALLSGQSLSLITYDGFDTLTEDIDVLGSDLSILQLPNSGTSWNLFDNTETSSILYKEETHELLHLAHPTGSSIIQLEEQEAEPIDYEGVLLRNLLTTGEGHLLSIDDDSNIKVYDESSEVWLPFDEDGTSWQQALNRLPEGRIHVGTITDDCLLLSIEQAGVPSFYGYARSVGEWFTRQSTEDIGDFSRIWSNEFIHTPTSSRDNGIDIIWYRSLSTSD